MERNKIRKSRETKRKIVYVSSNEDNNESDPNPNDDSSTTNERVFSHLEAVEECTRAVRESTFGKACIESYPNIDYKFIIDNCVFDIEVMILAATRRQNDVACTSF